MKVYSLSGVMGFYTQVDAEGLGTEVPVQRELLLDIVKNSLASGFAVQKRHMYPN